ncbi:MAG: hypothetical protein O2923_10965 [Verrucomicrobia bacterium]|nr:hypothetical protein [Verrucomicrobiota bacterium]MDA1088163.1 hypothetical protein [Verrucomicrobiota bacterium]
MHRRTVLLIPSIAALVALAGSIALLTGCEGNGGAVLDLDIGGSSASGSVVSVDAPLEVTISAF